MVANCPDVPSQRVVVGPMSKRRDKAKWKKEGQKSRAQAKAKGRALVLSCRHHGFCNPAVRLRNLCSPSRLVMQVEPSSPPLERKGAEGLLDYRRAEKGTPLGDEVQTPVLNART